MEKFRLENPNLGENEHLYHLAIVANDGLKERFGDVKFVCMGGKAKRMKNFAQLLFEELGKPDNSEVETGCDGEKQLKDIASSGGRYSMFKVGPVISVSHGMGIGSISIVLNELFKLIHFAGCSDVTFLRLGTSGGLGLDPGTVIITEKAYNGLLENCYRQVSCGKEYTYEASTDPELSKLLLKCSKKVNVKATIGNTLGTNDFYEEQARMDGAFCTHSAGEKAEFLKRAYDEFGIKNIEMESTCFTAMCKRAGIKCGVVCVAIVNRLTNDDVTSEADCIAKWEMEPQRLITELIKNGGQ